MLRTGRDSTCLRHVSVVLPDAAISVLKEASIQLKAEISNSERSENGVIQQRSHCGVSFSYPLKFVKEEINPVCWIHLIALMMQAHLLCFPGDHVPVLLLFPHDR